jgi:hypothetical protein
MNQQLLEYLTRIRLAQYVSVLGENGYTSWSQLLKVTEEDLHRLGFKLGHRRRLQREVATAEGYSRFRALPEETNSFFGGMNALGSLSKYLEFKASVRSRSSLDSASKQVQQDRFHADAKRRTIAWVYYNHEHAWNQQLPRPASV